MKEFESIIQQLKKEKETFNLLKKSSQDIRPFFIKPDANLNNDKKKKNEKQNNNQINKNNSTRKNNEINLIYTSQYKCYQNIFGEKFVKNNTKNIKLSVNGKESPLVHDFELKKGKNNVKMIIINKLTNLNICFMNVNH